MRLLNPFAVAPESFSDFSVVSRKEMEIIALRSYRIIPLVSPKLRVIYKDGQDRDSLSYRLYAEIARYS